MRYGIFSDVQGNYRALERFFAKTKNDVDEYFCLGDLVQNGAAYNENRCIDMVIRKECLVVRGNHEDKVIAEDVWESKKFDTAGEHTSGMLASLGRISDPAFSRKSGFSELKINLCLFSCSNPDEIADSPPVDILVEKADFKKISPENLKYLDSLPLNRIFSNYFLIHAPLNQRVLTVEQAKEVFGQLPDFIDICFFGHSHKPTLFCEDGAGKIKKRELDKGIVYLRPDSRHLINPGGVGLYWDQPRTYMVYDDDTRHLHLRRL